MDTSILRSILPIILFSQLLCAAEPLKPQAMTFHGQVYPTNVALKKLGILADDDTEGITLVVDDGQLFTIIKDDQSRMLYLDPDLHNRKLCLTAVKIPNTQMLQIKKVQTLKDGKLYNVDYWCDRCQLAATQPGRCICCGEVVFRRELPANSTTSGK
jgi:hypothetical protein